MHKFALFIISAWLLIFSCAERPVDSLAKPAWMTLAEAEAALLKEKRPILIDLYTDWCGWCKVMDKKTYSNKNVIDYLQKNFYPVKLDAETKEIISWNNKKYNFNASNKTNDFAIFLTYGQLSYPTTVIIPPGGGAPQPIPGYLQPKEIEIILKYFGEGKYGKQPFAEYQKNFKGTW